MTEEADAIQQILAVLGILRGTVQFVVDAIAGEAHSVALQVACQISILVVSVE